MMVDKQKSPKSNSVVNDNNISSYGLRSMMYGRESVIGGVVR